MKSAENDKVISMHFSSMIAIIFFQFISTAVSAIDVDTLIRQSENSFYKQNKESISKLYVLNNYLYYFDIEISGLCKVWGGHYFLKDSVFIVTTDSNSLCNISSCGDSIVTNSLRFITCGFDGIDITQISEENVVVSKASKYTHFVKSNIIPDIDSVEVELNFLDSAKGDSVLFPFECGYIYSVYKSSRRNYICIQMNNIALCYWGLGEINVGKGFIYKNSIIGTKTKELKVTGIKLY